MASAGQFGNPFGLDGTGDATDQELVSAAVGGDQGALEALIERHQPWIYNIAFRMVMVPEDAEDVTQEVLIKILTKLGSYDSEKGAFRTWTYRIVTNHVLNMKARGYEDAITGFDTYYSFVEQVPDREPEDTPETSLITEDLKIGCVMGTLLCLDRLHYLVPNRPVMRDIVARIEEESKEEVDSRFQALFRSHPFYSGKDMIPWLRDLLGTPEFENIFTTN